MRVHSLLALSFCHQLQTRLECRHGPLTNVWLQNQKIGTTCTSAASLPSHWASPQVSLQGFRICGCRRLKKWTFRSPDGLERQWRCCQKIAGTAGRRESECEWLVHGGWAQLPVSYVHFLQATPRHALSRTQRTLHAQRKTHNKTVVPVLYK